MPKEAARIPCFVDRASPDETIKKIAVPMASKAVVFHFDYDRTHL